MISKLIRVVLLAVAATGVMGMSGVSNAADGNAYLVKDGSPEAEIVVSPEPSRMARLAANELQSIIERISGAKLPIVETATAGRVHVYVGVSRYTEELGINVDDLAYGAYRIASGPDWLALVGPDRDFVPIEPWPRNRGEWPEVEAEWQQIAGEVFGYPMPFLYASYHPGLDIWEHDDAGTLNAVYDFLRQLGARWYFPGEIGEILPHMKSIPLPRINETVRPDFDVRRISYFKGFQGMTNDEMLWNLRQGFYFGHDLIGLSQPSHGMKFVHMTDAYKEKYPDHFAIWNGERVTTHKRVGAPCLSSEGLFENHLKYVRAMYDHFDQPLVNVDVVDGYFALCECPECSVQGAPERGFSGRMSDYLWGYMDRFARELYKTHPDRMVAALAYGGYALPPENIEQLSPNLALVMCQSRSGFSNPAAREAIEDLRCQWLEKLPSRQIFLHEYYLQSWPRRVDVGVPAYYPHLIAEDLRSLKGVARGELIEVYQHDRVLGKDIPWHELAIMHLNLYVTGRLWWDTDTDVDSLLDEYCQLFYGPAANQMKAYIEFGEQNFAKMRTSTELLDRAGELLAAAEAAVDPDSVYGKRVAMISEYFALTSGLREQLARGKEGPKIAIPGRSTDGLVLDGRLDDAFWIGLPEFAMVDVASGDTAPVATTFRMAWGDNDSLYIAIRCEEPDMAGLADTGTGDGDSNVWLGDFIELLLETPVHSYYQITISPSGVLLDTDRSDGLNSMWSASAQVATYKGDAYWSIELQLPAGGEQARELDPNSGVSGDKPQTDAPWYFNLCRQRVRGKTTQTMAFSPTGRPHFHDIFKFATVTVDDGVSGE